MLMKESVVRTRRVLADLGFAFSSASIHPPVGDSAGRDRERQHVPRHNIIASIAVVLYGHLDDTKLKPVG